MLAWIAAAWAQDPPTAPYLPIDSPPVPDWLVRSGTIWLRDADLCFPARAVDAASLKFLARICEEPTDELVCGGRFDLGDGWVWEDEDCRLGLTGPEGTRTTIGNGPKGLLVSADEHAATWSAAVTLQAVPGRAMVEVHPCDADSLAALAKDARKEVGRDAAAQAAWYAQRSVVDGQRRCDASEGAVAVAMAPGSVRSVTPGTRTSTAAVDCRQACPTPSAPSAVAALTSQIAGHGWYDPKAPTLRLYATKLECLNSPQAASHLDRDLCNSLGGQLRSQANPPSR